MTARYVGVDLGAETSKIVEEANAELAGVRARGETLLIPRMGPGAGMAAACLLPALPRGAALARRARSREG